ncbi:MAG TPA: serine protein kinase PrkA [Planctomycetota bacterium]|nr:serine protein kinase PrkA [Planctomycetota bacterium]
MVELSDFLKRVNDQSIEAFKGQKRILSFQQYIEAFSANPERLGRSAPQYVLDCFESYGSKKVDGIGGKFTHWNIFDAPWDEGRDPLVGQEAVQNELHRYLQRFAATGQCDKLVLLHGPNGSAKSTAIDLIIRGLEHYSMLEEGTQFRFNWIFTERSEGKGMGFGGGREEIPKDSLAFIDETLISCKLVSELRELPLFLIPLEPRAKLLDEIIAANPGKPLLSERLRGSFLREGQLSNKNKLIFDALMNAYRGDWLKVMRHVQVERYFVSKRYRTGAAAIEPQQAVDAGAKPMSFEHGVILPPVLQGLPLMDLIGELVEASGGIVEYSDFLKRNLELNKYLLSTVERGEVNLPGAVATLNLVMLGNCNEKQLSAFKQMPDFTSYKGRIELVRAPYLLEWKKERAIYGPFIAEIAQTRHVAPHTIDVAALWAVLTRLRRPDPGKYSSELAGVIRRLTPLDKAKLYDGGVVPEGLSTEEKRLLRSAIPQLRDEHRDTIAEFEGFVCAAYEGRRGASAREMNSLIAEAASDSSRKFLSPLAVLQALERLLHDKSVYDFLRLEPDEGYHDCELFTEEVRNEYFRWVSVEVYDSMGLVEETEYDRRVEDYFKHVRAYVAGEKIQNPRTGAFETPSTEIMEGLEKLMTLRESPDAFRRNLITKIAAYSLEHPREKIDYHEIFADLFKNLRDSYYKDKSRALIQLAKYVLVSGTEDDALVPQGERHKVDRTLKMMREKYGYIDDSAKEAISFVLRVVQERE